MGKILIIGSTVCDVMIYLDKLPHRQGDAHIQRQVMRLGGCAFNVAHLLHQLGSSYTFISPVGQGIYGQFVRQSLKTIGMANTINLEGENGCCYCFVEADGERTFLSDHGVEYQFDANWLKHLKPDDYDYIYICGLEIEETTGDDLVDALKHFSGRLVFAPGPRGALISKERLNKIYHQKPILHLNEQEAKTLGNSEQLKTAILNLFARTGQPLIVTQGEKGCLAFDGKQWHHALAYPSKVTDTIGAGDSHISAILASLLQNHSLVRSLDFANYVASKIVSTQGVHLSNDSYHDLKQRLKSGQ